MTECDKVFPDGLVSISRPWADPSHAVDVSTVMPVSGKRHLTKGRDDAAMVKTLQHKAGRAI